MTFVLIHCAPISLSRCSGTYKLLLCPGFFLHYTSNDQPIRTQSPAAKPSRISPIRSVAAMDSTQKWADLEGIYEKSTMTEDEKRKQKERKARELEKMVSRAEIALQGNKRLLEKRQVERKFGKKNWDEHLGDYKGSLQSFRLAKPGTQHSSASKEMDPVMHED